jgi:YD repeat-containing protein
MARRIFTWVKRIAVIGGALLGSAGVMGIPSAIKAWREIPSRPETPKPSTDEPFLPRGLDLPTDPAAVLDAAVRLGERRPREASGLISGILKNDANSISNEVRARLMSYMGLLEYRQCNIVQAVKILREAKQLSREPSRPLLKLLQRVLVCDQTQKLAKARPSTVSEPPIAAPELIEGARQILELGRTLEGDPTCPTTCGQSQDAEEGATPDASVPNDARLGLEIMQGLPDHLLRIAAGDETGTSFVATVSDSWELGARGVSLTFPDGTSETATHDELGRLVAFRDRIGEVTTYSYDDLGRLTSVRDGNLCTADGCDPAGGVVHVPTQAGSSWSDGSACNAAETPDNARGCQPGTPVTCTTSDPCHDAIGDVTSYSWDVAGRLEPVAYARGWTSAYRYNGVALGPIPVLGLESTYDESVRLHRIGSLTTTCGATCATKTRPGPDEMQPQLALVNDGKGNAFAWNGINCDLALPSIQIGSTSGRPAGDSEPQALEDTVLVRTSDGVAYDALSRMGRRATTATRPLSATFATFPVFATPRSERESHAQLFVFLSARGDSYSERLSLSERSREGRAWSLAIAGDQLGYAADDAIRMHETLARLGYSSSLLTGSNARSATVLRWISDRSLSSEPEDQIVIHYSGHGVANADDERWLVLSSADGSPDYLSVDQLSAALRSFRGTATVIVDACATLADVPTSLSHAVATEIGSMSRSPQFIYSASLGEIAVESPRIGGGLFTNAVVQYLSSLRRPPEDRSTFALDTDSLFRFVSEETTQEALHRHGVVQSPVRRDGAVALHVNAARPHPNLVETLATWWKR